MRVGLAAPVEEDGLDRDELVRVGEDSHGGLPAAQRDAEPVAVGVLEPAESVAETIAHYNLLAVPVVDDEGMLVGIVTVDDAIDTVAPSAWRRRLPRVFARADRDDEPKSPTTAGEGRG